MFALLTYGRDLDPGIVRPEIVPAVCWGSRKAVLTMNCASGVQVPAVGCRKCLCGAVPVAIKRTSKSKGTPVRKTVTSPGLRHIDVRAPAQLVPGDLYPGWVCKNKSCGLVIAIVLAQAGSTSSSAESDDQLAVIKCPHCGDENLYRWSARSELKYTPKSPGA